MKRIDVAIAVVGTMMVVYHLVSTQVLLQLPIEHQNTHYMFSLMLIYLIAIRKKKRLWPLYATFLIISIIATSYIKIYYFDLEARAGSPITTDVIIGCLLLLMGIWATKEAFGWALPVIASVFLIYFFIAGYLPPPLHHFPQSPGRIISLLSTGLSGMYGMVLGVSANYIFLFIVFGALMQAFGATAFFMELGRLIGKRLRSGPAMTAVVSSCLVGMVSGSAVANVGMTGVFTIPLMKKTGYRPEVAGAIEAAASSGGQIMPPVMGAAAFLMAEVIGVPYIQLCIMAALPAFYYYFTCGTYVQLQSAKITVSPDAENVDKRLIITRAPLFIVPLAVLVFLMAQDHSPMFAIFWTIVTLAILGCLRKETRPSWSKLIKSVTDGAIGGAQIGVSSACIGTVVTTLTMTGLAFKLSSIVEALSGGNLFLALFITMFVSLILGCGVPTMAAYMVVAIAVCPALVHLGANLYASHFFALYFAIFSAVTPPVAMASLVASTIAGTGYMKTAIESCKVASAGFLLPFLIVFCPSLILQFSGVLTGFTHLIASAVLLFCTVVAAVGYYLLKLNLLERATAFICCVILFAYAYTQNYIFFIIGICLFIFVTVIQWRRRAHIAK